MQEHTLTEKIASYYEQKPVSSVHADSILGGLIALAWKNREKIANYFLRMASSECVSDHYGSHVNYR